MVICQTRPALQERQQRTPQGEELANLSREMKRVSPSISQVAILTGGGDKPGLSLKLKMR